MEQRLVRVKRAAILGAGVMGAQIAAHLASAGIQVLLYELAGTGSNPNEPSEKALAVLAKLNPAPLASASVLQAIRPVNYDQHLQLLSHCDLVIEAVAERPDIKAALYQRIAPVLAPNAILATNTSGISIGYLSRSLPDTLKPRFLGVHFFNPPRYMHLVELIPHPGTDPEVMDLLENLLTSGLGKGVVRAKDTPGFIGNRIGVFSSLAVLHHAERLALPLDLVDKLTGPGIGRPKSATLRTLDVVGLDTFAHVVGYFSQVLKDDPWHAHYRVPGWMTALIGKGALGQKTGSGIYAKVGKEIHVLDPGAGGYRPVKSSLEDPIRAVLNERDPTAKFAALKKLKGAQAEFLRCTFADVFHYSAYHLGSIAHAARDVDLAMRWGYGWQQGPFESWQEAGVKAVAAQIDKLRSESKTMSSAPLPEWLTGLSKFHTAKGSWSPSAAQYVPASKHPVYARQLYPVRVSGETGKARETVVFENDATRLWHSGDGIAVLGFKTKMHTVSAEVLESVLRAVEVAESEFKGLVLWHGNAPFSAGANLFEAVGAVRAGRYDQIEAMVDKFQRASMALKHSSIPTVVAIEGLALGGGCEFTLHADRAVAALESYIGLVETGVGLVPAGGGCKELAVRADVEDRVDALPAMIARYFSQVAMAKTSTSAMDARDLGYLRPADCVVFHPQELLYVAKQQVVALHESGYRPPIKRDEVRVAGASAAATLTAQLVNMRAGGFISDHDFEIGRRLALVMCGGEVDPGSRVSEDWLLKLERDAFVELIKTEKTQARIQHTLMTGKPLRN